MSATRPDAVADLCAKVRALADQTELAYAWLYDSGYQGRRGGRHPAAGADAYRLVLSDVEAQQARRLLDKAARKVTAAKLALGDAADALGRLADVIDEGEDRTLPDVGILRSLGNQSDNRADGEAAAARRAARGATMPGSDYPRAVIHARRAG